MKSKWKDAAVDAFGIVGAAAISYGVYLVYEPAGIIVVGLLLIAAAYVIETSK